MCVLNKRGKADFTVGNIYIFLTTCILGRTYFVERPIHLIEEHSPTTNNHRSSGFVSNY